MVATIKTILVTSALGSTSAELVKSLSASGKFTIRAGARSLSKFQSSPLASLPRVEFVQLDDNPQTALSAFANVDGVFLLTSHPALPVFDVWFDAILKCNVKQVVLHSAMSAALDVDFLLSRAHIKQEQAVIAAAAAHKLPYYTIHRSANFHQNVDKFLIPRLRVTGCVSGSGGDGRYAVVDVRDLADAAVAVFSDPVTHNGKIYTMTGELTSDPAMAELISEVTGKKIEYKPITVEEHRARVANVPLPPGWVREDLVIIDQEKREEWIAFVKSDLETLLGRKPRGFKQYIKEQYDAGAFN